MARHLTRNPLWRAIAVSVGALVLGRGVLAACNTTAKPAAPAPTTSTSVSPTVEYFSSGN
jgi:hypothetical protein